ncbi:MAG TPA: ATP-binding protein [Longimicrobium sp.]|nr:ATP-binding protein [Longimicrobium sp.]
MADTHPAPLSPDDGPDADAGFPAVRRILAQWPTPVCVLEGPAHVFTAASDAYRALVGGRDLLGRPFAEAVPELARQGFAALMDRVHATGERQEGSGVPVLWDRDGDGVGEEGFADFVCQPLRGRDGRVRGVLVEVGDATGRVRTERRLAERHAAAARRTERLQALTAALAAALTPAEVGAVVIDQGTAALGADAGLVAYLSEGGTHLEVAEWRGYAAEVVERWQRIPLDARVPLAEAVRRGVPVVVRSAEERAERFPELAASAARFPASVSVPLVVEGRAVGAMGLSFLDGRALEPADEEMLLAFGRLCAQAVRRAGLFAEAQHARAEAEAANRAKSDFLATMSHEIRTPLNAVMGYADLLEMEIAGPLNPGQRAHLARIRASSAHLRGLIDDVLDFAKVEAGRMDVERERQLAVGTLAAALAMVRVQAEQRGIALEDPCAGDQDTAYVGDEARVRQILANLLSNAVKFTEAGGTVRVTCGTERAPDPAARLVGEGPWTYLRVEDTGVGIAPERLEEVFRPFVQVETGHTRTQGGTGLGLTISRRLARLMDGDLTAASAPGRGSAFTLWLPAEARRAPSLDAAVLADTRGGTAPPRGLAVTGFDLLNEIDAVLRSFAARLRVDPRTSAAATVQAEPDLMDHTASLLADIAHSLSDLGRQEGDLAGLMRDGSEIQRTIAALHGRQRHRLGWSAEALRAEFGILREELAAAVRRQAPAGTEVEGVTGLLDRFLGSAERLSVEAFQRAALDVTPS